MKTQNLEIIDLGHNGDGIARMPDGQTVFVPFTMNGDTVRAEISKDHDGKLRGKICEIVTPSHDRQAAPCRHFGKCGGCALQHLKPEQYQSFKERSVIDALGKHGLEPVLPIETVYIPAGTRRRANFAARIVKGKAIIGFHERKSSTIRDVPDCLLITEDVRRVMEALRPFLPDIAGEGNKIDVLIQCVRGNAEIALTGKIAPGWEAQQALADALRATNAARISIRARDYEIYQVLLEEKSYFIQFGNLSVNLAPGAFLQPSDEGEAALTNSVMREVGDAPRAADLFCGNGTFTGPLMEGRDLIAVDIATDSIKALKKASINSIDRNLFKDPLDEYMLSDRDVVVLDPPRAGAAAQVVILARTDVPKVVYVSCNPQSFAKDAAVLVEGGYKFEKLTIVDQFIWSTHCEVVGSFVKAR
jgi:23S rRNA (uracil1939-C5)-methyltransferase